jgi:hypothetical protein
MYLFTIYLFVAELPQGAYAGPGGAAAPVPRGARSAAGILAVNEDLATRGLVMAACLFLRRFATLSSHMRTLSMLRRSRTVLAVAEYSCWFFIALVIASRFFYSWLRFPRERQLVVFDNFLELLVSVLVVAFPVIFRLIFDALPLEFVRRRMIVDSNIRRRVLPADGPHRNREKDTDPADLIVSDLPIDDSAVGTQDPLTSSSVGVASTCWWVPALLLQA